MRGLLFRRTVELAVRHQHGLAERLEARIQFLNLFCLRCHLVVDDLDQRPGLVEGLRGPRHLLLGSSEQQAREFAGSATNS